MRRLILFSAALVSAISCSFLSEKPLTQLSQDEIYNTESGLETAVYGCYRGLLGSSSPACSMQEFLQCGSGLCHWRYDKSFLSDINRTCLLDFTQYSQNVYSDNCFKDFYSGIQNCNSLIGALESSPVDEAVKKKVGAEARFVRALIYYYLVRIYGDVPLVLESPISYQDGHAPRTPFWTVYTTIIEDLTIAENDMPEYEKNQTRSGRVCKWAATSLKASVYLTIGSLLAHPDDNFWNTGKRVPDFSACGIVSAEDAFELALAAADKVISEGPYSLASSYDALFRWTDGDDWTLPERIIVIPNTVQTGASFAAIRSLPRYINTADDGNKNYGRFRPSRFVFQKWCQAYGGDDGEGKAAGIKINCRDPRLETCMYYNYYHDCNTGQDKSIYPASSKIMLTTPDAKTMQPYLKKYYDPRYAGNSGYADFYVMRFAELFLISAEASANLSSSVGDPYWLKAYERIERIHSRARKSSDPDAQPRWASDRFSSKMELLDGIFWERVFEMLGEGHEWFDTHRFGAAWLSMVIAQPKNDFLKLKEQADFTSSGKNYLGYTSYLYGVGFQYKTETQELRKSLLCAFPESEILYNHNISESDQNDYWWK